MNVTATNSVRDLLRDNGKEFGNLESASLRLNKFAQLEKNMQREGIDAVCAISAAKKDIPGELHFADCNFELELGSRLIVNHAGGIFENSGLCLHPFFNCPMIPGSALKGISAHCAYEQFEALENSQEAEATAKTIIRVFGYPTGNKKLNKFIKTRNLHQSDAKGNELASAANISFLSATPCDTNWQLVTDIQTPHGGNDYTNPVPIPFLAVASGAKFRFCLKKINNGSDDDLEQAEQWLKKALCQNGAGAKTNAGYGWFKGGKFNEKTVRLDLVSPAFLGGASHDCKDDTELRVPSLRGVLRWWWCTLYRGVLENDQLQKLQDIVWGSTEKASLIRLKVVSTNSVCKLFNYKDRFDLSADFAGDHNIDPKRSGLLYMAYGMDEKLRGEIKQRFYIEPGANWVLDIKLRNRQKSYDILGKQIDANDVIEQCFLALSLLSNFGGIGSKSRKGFGSLSWDHAYKLDECMQKRDHFVEKLCMSKRLSDLPDYCLENAYMTNIEIATADSWHAIDALGRVVQKFAGEYKHNSDKAALGLPRKIHGPLEKPLRHQSTSTHQKPKNLMPVLREAQNESKTRFSAPVFYHFEKSDDGKRFVVNITAFPSGMLTLKEVSKRMLKGLISSIKSDCELSRYKLSYKKHSSQHGRRDAGSRFKSNEVDGLKAGSKVRVTMLEEKTKKGGWKAAHSVLGKGAIQNSTEVGADAKAGAEVDVIVAVAKKGAAAFKWIN